MSVSLAADAAKRTDEHRRADGRRQDPACAVGARSRRTLRAPVIEAGEKKAGALGQPMNIAVADAGGNIVAHVRMDGAWIGSIDISQKKAYTSRAFDIATKDLAEHSQSGNQFFGIHASNSGKIMIFAGGVPLKRDGQVVGAVGVSGGSGEQDHAVAEAAAAAF